MVVLGIDAHKRSHTVVAVDDIGRKLGERTLGTTTADHLVMLTWAEQFGADRLWAVEDCRHLSRRLERDLLGAGERIARVPPKLMAHVRDSARSYGKSDPIDALAVARAALREPNLPTAALDGPAREVRLLANHRDDLVAERTRVINRLRWHLHELDPSWQPPARSLWRPKNLAAITQRLTDLDGLVARLARTMVERCSQLTAQIRDLDHELEPLVTTLAPTFARTVWLRHPDRREDRRRDRRCRAVPISPRLRPPQRHSTHPGLVKQPRTSPAQPHRQPPAQHGPAPDSDHPGALPPARPRVPATPPCRR
jgi:transposase